MSPREAGVKHVPVRTCVVTRERRPQAELLRLARTPDGWVPDPRRRLPGRGAYVAPDRPEVLEVKRLRRFARQDAEGLAERLRAYLSGLEPGSGDIQT